MNNLTNMILAEARKELHQEIINDYQPFLKYVKNEIFERIKGLIVDSYGTDRNNGGPRYNQFELIPLLMTNGYSSGRAFRDHVIDGYLQENAQKYIERFYNLVAASSRKLPELQDITKRLNKIEADQKEFVKSAGLSKQIQDLSFGVLKTTGIVTSDELWAQCDNCHKFKPVKITINSNEYCSEQCFNLDSPF